MNAPLEKCYLCGSTENLTGDHIPPKGFFKPPRPNNLIKVRCCQQCNNSFSKDDDATRLWFSGLLGVSATGEWILENKALTNTVKRAPGLLAQMISTAREVKLATEDGVVDSSAFSPPRERVNGFLVRTVKGLLTHYYPQYDYSTDEFVVSQILPTPENLTKFKPVVDALSYDSRGGDVFQFRHGLIGPNQSGAWILMFYEAVIFLVLHSKSKWRKLA